MIIGVDEAIDALLSLVMTRIERSLDEARREKAVSDSQAGYWQQYRSFR